MQVCVRSVSSLWGVVKQRTARSGERVASLGLLHLHLARGGHTTLMLLPSIPTAPLFLCLHERLYGGLVEAHASLSCALLITSERRTKHFVGQ